MKCSNVFQRTWLPLWIVSTCLLSQTALARAEDAYWNTMKSDRILFIGNSITLHGPRAEVGWSGYWGMAATEQSKDYVHTLTSTICAITGRQLTVAAAGGDGADNIINVASIFEQNYATYDNSKLQTQLDYKADIVILQFGENMAAVSTPAQKAVFKSKLELLLDGLKASSNPNIFVTSYILAPNDTVDAIKREVCDEDPTHRMFVDLGGFRSDARNRASYEGVFTNEGVAAHPGNRGMQYIADELFTAMQARSVLPEPCSGISLTAAAMAFAAIVWYKGRR